MKEIELYLQDRKHPVRISADYVVEKDDKLEFIRGNDPENGEVVAQFDTDWVIGFTVHP